MREYIIVGVQLHILIRVLHSHLTWPTATGASSTGVATTGGNSKSQGRAKGPGLSGLA